MNTTAGDWSLAEPDDLIVGADGNAWRVMTRSGPDVTLSRVKDGKAHAGRPSGPVQFLAGAWMERNALKVLREHGFGGAIVSRQRADGTHLCPVDYPAPDTMLAHLSLFHGTTAPDGERDLATLRRVHANLHNTTDTYEPHVHDPDWTMEAAP
jgi:hypothetical protein